MDSAADAAVPIGSPAGVDLAMQHRDVGLTRSSSLCLHVLESFNVREDHRSVRLPTVCERLLAYLAVAGPTHRNVLCGRLWPEASEQSARASLRNAFWVVGRQVPNCITVKGGTVELAADVEVDLNCFQRLAWAVLEGHDDVCDNLSHETLFSFWSSAELLPGWYDDWLDDPREQVRQLRMHALEALCSVLNRKGRHAAALHVALEVARMEPLRESSASAVIGIHLRERNLVEAKRWFEAFRRRLWNELGVLPSDELTAMLPNGLAGRGTRQLGRVGNAHVGGA
jgi:DNA-binding SARP family transcriptional activator